MIQKIKCLLNKHKLERFTGNKIRCIFCFKEDNIK